MSGKSGIRVDFRQMLENQPVVNMRLRLGDGVWKTDFVTANVERYGVLPQDFVDGRMTWIDLVHPDDRVLALKEINDYAERRIDDFRLHYRVLTPDGESVRIQEYNHINRDHAGGVDSIDSFLFNLSEFAADAACADGADGTDGATGAAGQTRSGEHFRRQGALTDLLLSLHESEIERAVPLVLARVGTYLDCSRALLFREAPDRQGCSLVEEWRNHGIHSLRESQPGGADAPGAAAWPETRAALAQTGLLLQNGGDSLEFDRDELEREGVVSSAAFSVFLRGKPYGFLRFDDCVIQRRWDPDVVNFLRIAANLVSSITARLHAEDRVRGYEAEVKRLAFHDYLTGLPNRFQCDADLARAVVRAREAGKKGHLLFIDLDDFKIVNDTHGHDYGDGVLKSFADHLRRECAGAADAGVYRFGGDEFVVLLPPADGAPPLEKRLGDLLERAQKPWRSLDKEFYCSLSIGVVAFPSDGAEGGGEGGQDDARAVLKRADIAMYQAKRAGKNNYAFFRDGLDGGVSARAEMEPLLRHALENDMQGFTVLYQPYVDITDERRHILGAEALIRMRAPDGTLILPDQFLPLAEYLGMIVPMGEFVMREAAKLCRRINDSGMPTFRMTVNLSAKQFKQRDILVRLEDILARSGVDFGNMVVAINEGVAIGELERMLRLGNELRKKGVRVALDDFGSGASSFINMRNLPVDVIKVSSRYIDTIEDHFSGYFIKLVSDLSHFTNKTVCVNGVETEEQLAFCRKMGVDLVQGFLFHLPGNVEALVRALENERAGNSRRLKARPKPEN